VHAPHETNLDARVGSNVGVIKLGNIVRLDLVFKD
jgi:hypothetical protein